MEIALVNILLAASGLTALVGQRVYWGRRPQSVSNLPAVLLTRIDGVRDYNTDGASGLVSSRVQADIYALTYDAAKNTANALVAAVNGVSASGSGVVIQRISIDSERDSTETENTDRVLSRTSIDLIIWHDE